MKDNIKKIIGMRINGALGDVTQKELAEHLKVKPNVISYFCKGDRTPNTEQIIMIADYLNVSADYLLGRTKTPSIDEDIQQACKTTGLSEDAVKMLNEEVKHLSESPKDIESYRQLEIASELIANHTFWGIASELRELEYCSKELLQNPYNIDIEFIKRVSEVTKIPIEQLKKHLEEHIKSFHNSDRQDVSKPKVIHDLVTDCDVTRYTITRMIEKINDLYDHREDYKNYDKQQLIEYLNLKPLIDETKQEGADHGKHNKKE